ncbi:PQQ-dependent catabolism-associated CXXCW motif protein [Roseivivax sediminis]|uniref:PQQ-dependent catabolism-associated CXXCW motif protein n=1 Tax=Roseivivax sediminis TaxID=936889 RepID=A0A1I1U2B2_9RHOB|nr:PQQ-dependent catabolism-associated CXXCW motif protein [Roseivivax sediminis]SFD62823.1 PQQ-dependent catabolism-associated CXXCW motif protein [Roseivivax sediminis]
MMRWPAALLIAALPAFALAQAAEEPAGYRMDDYRAPVPATLDGARVVGPEGAHELWKAGETAFIDVLPRAPKPKNLPEGTIWRDTPRQSVPGATWLPNVGYGAIAEETADYFRAGLDVATGGDKDHPVLFFCLEACWMSWNAAKRALEYGYSEVYWLPEGTDGWALWDYPLEVIEPMAGEP